MSKLLLSVFQFMLSSAFSRVLTGAGLSLFSYSFLSTIFTSMVASYVSSFSLLNAGFGFLSISGVIEANNILLSALFTRVAIKSLNLRLCKSS
jgi:hypothetical protein